MILKTDFKGTLVRYIWIIFQKTNKLSPTSEVNMKLFIHQYVVLKDKNIFKQIVTYF